MAQKGAIRAKKDLFQGRNPQKSSTGRQNRGQKPCYHLLLTHPVALQISRRLASDSIVTYSAIIGFIRLGRRIPPKGSQTSQDAHDVGRLQAPFTAAGLFRRYDHRPSTPYKNSEDKIEDKKKKKQRNKRRKKRKDQKTTTNTYILLLLFTQFFKF